MLSKKMAVSLTSLITILALAFVVYPEMAAGFTTELSGDGTIDAGNDIDVTIKFEKEVTLAAVQAVKIGIIVVNDDYTTEDAEVTGAGAGEPLRVPNNADTSLDETDFTPVMQKDIDLSMAGDQYDGKTFVFTIDADAIPAVNTVGDNDIPGPTKIHVSIPEGIASLDPADDDTSDAATLTIDLRGVAKPPSDTPRVVSVQRLRPGSQLVVAAFEEELVTGTFDVRIVLTEKHPNLKDGLSVADIKKYIDIQHGEPINVRVGLPFSRIGEALTSPLPATLGATEFGQIANTTNPYPTEGKYWHSASAAYELQGVPRPVLSEDNTADNATEAARLDQLVPLPTGDDNRYYQYRVRIRPHDRKGTDPFDVKIKVKNFNNGGSPSLLTYVSPEFVDSVKLPNGRDILTVKVQSLSVDVKPGYRVTIPADLWIPANGYLVIAQNTAGSEIDTSGQDADRTNDPPRSAYRTPAQMEYNVYATADLPNLATQFQNGVVVDVESLDRELLITEVMWGEDVSLPTSSNSQYIELYNPGDGYKTIADKPETPWLNEAVTLVFYAPNEFDLVPKGEEFREGFLVDASGKVLPSPPWWTDGVYIERPDQLPWYVSDRIGTLDGKGAYWSPAGKGQSGRSGKTSHATGELTIGRGPVEASVPIISMYRVMDANGTPKDGQMAVNWMSSEGPKSANFNPLAIGIRHGTPGAATKAIETPADVAADTQAKEDKAKADQAKIDNTGTYPNLGDGRVYISEIMFAGDGLLPQWIEIANGDLTKEFNLSDWTLTVDNAIDDKDVSIGATATFTIPKGTKIAPSKVHNPAGDNMPSTILVVTESGRNSFTRANEAAQVINLAMDNEVELIQAGVLKRRYTLLSDIAFRITLAPGVPAATKAPAGETAAAKTKRLADEKKEKALREAAVDMVGNLGADGAAMWALPTNEGARSSIIRRHVDIVRGPKAPEDGVEMGNWALTADTAFADPTHGSVNESYYGAANDVGTPGFRAGGALPVELSHFRPARDKATGAVVITWSTQSELNNAGFYIKRSNQRNGEFKVVNATMIAGAGTTSEKQFYTYTDTTAQPNVVYYYQIEDVSLDGNRQTLTRGIRLKGHVGAAGKATTTWGELKTSHE